MHSVFIIYGIIILYASTTFEFELTWKGGNFETVILQVLLLRSAYVSFTFRHKW